MAHEQQHHMVNKLQYPLDPNSYRILHQIGVGVSATVYKAICIPMNSNTVAIKAIDLDRSRADIDSVRRETKTMSLSSHPNILSAHCSFTVGRHLWVVMPFMSCGSLQSIITSCFPNGLPEPCIAIILRETLNAVSYLHKQGHLHRDIKAGNILVDSDGSVKLADFGVSASVHEQSTSILTGLCSSSSFRLTDVAGTPYWMAPEVVHSHTGYSFKADVWSFGITALELAHGRPPLSHLPPSKSLLMKITKRFRFSDYENTSNRERNKKFSKAFKEMVASCLNQDPAKRPTAEKLLKHSFFKSSKGPEFLVKNILNGLPNVEERYFEESKNLNKNQEEELENESVTQIVKHRRISGWNFNEDVFQLDPVFPTEDSSCTQSDQNISQSGKANKLVSGNNAFNSPGGSEKMESDAETISDQTNDGVVVDKNSVVEGLVMLKKSLDVQRDQVAYLISQLGGEMTTREDNVVQVVEKLRLELEAQRQRTLELEMELEFLKIQISGEYTG